MTLARDIARGQTIIVPATNGGRNLPPSPAAPALVWHALHLDNGKVWFIFCTENASNIIAMLSEGDDEIEVAPLASVKPYRTQDKETN